MLPNVRKLFKPDPGHEMFDIDLSSADLRIVTWESNCRLMKEWFKEGLDPYTMVAREYYHEPAMTKKDPRRQRFKSLCHATNYLGVAKNIAANANIGLSVAEVARVQEWYFKLCPEIKAWQDRIKAEVDRSMTVRNVFGYRRKIFERKTANTYNEVVAWIPQSTVGILINHAMENIDNNLPLVELLMQVHDSLVGQYPIEDAEQMREAIIKESQIVLPYPEDPLIIPVGIKYSTESWGDCG